MGRVRERLVVGFQGVEAPRWLDDTPPDELPAGFIIGRHDNVADVSQVVELTSALQRHATTDRPFLITADEEGGQLSAFAGLVTPFPGAMALAATCDAGLAHRVASATARELNALGVNVVWAPVADVATVPGEASTGIRSFGDDVETVTSFTAAMVTGYQAEGVSATVKHLVGQGSAIVDPHHALPLIDLDENRLEDVELRPFHAAVQAGVDLLMVGHYAVPALTGDPAVPLSASPALENLVRRRLGFEGVIVSDALDMVAFTGSASATGVVAAGVDLLLCMADEAQQRSAALAVTGDRPGSDRTSRTRIDRLRRARVGVRPDPEIVRSHAHSVLAAEVAAKSITVVRTDGRPPPSRHDRTLAVMPDPTDLTPADTSSFHPAALADALGRHADAVTSVVVPIDPSPSGVTMVVDASLRHDVVVVGTIDAASHPGQAAMVNRLVGAHQRVITVALRTPVDLTVYPAATSHLCTYGLLRPSLDALSDVLFGRAEATGRLPVAIPGIAPSGFHAKMP